MSFFPLLPCYHGIETNTNANSQRERAAPISSYLISIEVTEGFINIYQDNYTQLYTLYSFI